MNVGIIGSGPVAQSLGAGFLKHGHAVMLGTRGTAKLAQWRAQHAAARIGSFADAAAFGEIVVLAVKGDVALDALRLAGATALAGKVVVDATNPIAAAPPVNGVLKFFTALDDSLMERLQKANLRGRGRQPRPALIAELVDALLHCRNGASRKAQQREQHNDP